MSRVRVPSATPQVGGYLYPPTFYFSRTLCTLSATLTWHEQRARSVKIGAGRGPCSEIGQRLRGPHGCLNSRFARHVSAVADLLGHSSISVTGEVYGHTSDDADRAAIEGLTGALGL
jgi:integrase